MHEIARVIPPDAHLTIAVRHRVAVGAGSRRPGPAMPLRGANPGPAIDIVGCTTGQANVSRDAEPPAPDRRRRSTSRSPSRKNDSATGRPDSSARRRRRRLPLQQQIAKFDVSLIFARAAGGRRSEHATGSARP